MACIAVVGNAKHSYPAERATVQIVVGLEGSHRESVARESIEIHNRIAAAARAHHEAGAATWWSADRVVVSPFKEYVKNSDTTVTKHRARSSVEVKFQDFGALAEWVSGLAETKGVVIAGIEWTLTEARRAEVEVFIDWFNHVWKGWANELEGQLSSAEPDRARVAALSSALDTALGHFERLLDGRDFVMGESLNAADVIVYPFLKYAAGREAADDELFHRMLDEHQSLCEIVAHSPC